MHTLHFYPCSLSPCPVSLLSLQLYVEATRGFHGFVPKMCCVQFWCRGPGSTPALHLPGDANGGRTHIAVLERQGGIHRPPDVAFAVSPHAHAVIVLEYFIGYSR
jgi:hypothetical protein